MADERQAVQAWLRGHRAAEVRQRELRALEGPRPDLAVAESFAALNAAQDMGLWPAPRSAYSQRSIDQVRRRWAQIQHRARKIVKRVPRKPASARSKATTSTKPAKRHRSTSR